MTTVVKTFTWDSTIESFVTTATTGAGNYTAERDSGNGDPSAGSLHAWCLGRKDEVNGVFDLTGINWEDLGVPAGRPVIAVQVTDIRTRYGLVYDNVPDTFGPVTVHLYAGGTTTEVGGAAPFTRGSSSSADGSWQSGSGTQLPVNASYQSSTQSLEIQIDAHALAGNNGSAAAGVHVDTLQFTITYVGTETGSFTADAVIAAPMAGSFTLDAVRREPGGSFTADAALFEERAGSFTVDAAFSLHVEDTFTVYAEKANGGDFSIDATIFATVTGQVFTGGAPITVGSVSGTGAFISNPSWTHSPTADDKALVVLIGSSDGVATSVTYGNKPMTKRVGLHPGSATGWDDTEIWTLEDLSGRDDDVIRVTDTNTATVSLMLRTTDAVEFVDWQTTDYVSRPNGTVLRQTYVDDGYPFTSFVTMMYDRYYYNYLVPARSAISPHDYPTIHASKGDLNQGFRFGSFQGLDVGIVANDSSSRSGLVSIHQKGAGVLSDGLRVDAIIAPRRFSADALILGSGGDYTFTAAAVIQIAQDTLWLRQLASSDTPYTYAMCGAGTGDPWVSLADGSDIPWYEEHCYPTRDDTTSFVTKTANTVAGPTNGIMFGSNDVFCSPGFNGDRTISGQITINIWAAESAVGANAALNVAFYKRTPTGAVTLLGKTSRTTELTTSPAAVNFTYTPPSAWEFESGDRLMVVPFISDGGGTMAAGNTASIYYNTSTPSGQGDSWIQSSDVVNFFLEEDYGEYWYANHRQLLEYLHGPNESVRACMMYADFDTGVGVSRDTVDGWTEPVALEWPRTGEEPIWYSPAMTAEDVVGDLGGITITVHAEDDGGGIAGNNAALGAEMALVDKHGSVIEVLGYGVSRYAFNTAYRDTYWVHLPVRQTVVPVGSRFRMRLFLDDAGGGGGSGAMISGAEARLNLCTNQGDFSTSGLFPLVYRTAIRFMHSYTFFGEATITTISINGDAFTADAWIRDRNGGFTANAVIQKTQTTGIFLRKRIETLDSMLFMAMSADTTHIAVAKGGEIWVYHGDEWETKTVIDVASLTSWATGLSDIKISSDGSKVLAGYSYANTGVNLQNGEIAVFDGTDWATVDVRTETTPTDYRRFGAKIAISRDDQVIAVSGPGNNYWPYGYVWAFDTVSTDWDTQYGPWSGAEGDNLGKVLVLNDDGSQLFMGSEDWDSARGWFDVGQGKIRYGTNWASQKTGAPFWPYHEYSYFGASESWRACIDNDYPYGTVWIGRQDVSWNEKGWQNNNAVWYERWAGGAAVWPTTWIQYNPNFYERMLYGVISDDSRRAYFAGHIDDSSHAPEGWPDDQYRVVLLDSSNRLIAEGPWLDSTFALYNLQIGWSDSSVIAAHLYKSGGTEVLIYKYGQYSFTADAVLQPGGQITVDAVIAQFGGEFSADAIAKATIEVTALTADAVITVSGFTAFGDFTADAIRTETFEFVTLTADAVKAGGETTGSFTADAVKAGLLPIDAVVEASIMASATADASIQQTIEGSFLADATITTWYVRKGLATVDAVIKVRKESFYVDAVTAEATFPGRGWFVAKATVRTERTGTLALDAFKARPGFKVDAIIGTKVVRLGAFIAKAWIDLDEQTRSDYTFIDAYIDSYWSDYTFTIDAEVVGTLKEASFFADADISAVGEIRGMFAASGVLTSTPEHAVVVYAQIEEHPPILLDAVIAGIVHLDAIIYGAPAGSFTVDARLAHEVVIDATILAPVAASFGASSVFADAAGDIRQFNLDAVLQAVVDGGGLEVNAVINGATSSFVVDAVLNAGITADAFIQPYFTANAYIETTSVVVYPPSQSGTDGTSTDGSTFSSPTGDFGADEVGSTITINGVDYTIVSVIDEQTVTVSGGSVDFGEGDLDWSIPSGDATDPVGDDPPVTRTFKVKIEWKRPGRFGSWTDMTGDVIFEGAEFTQTARVSPGTFTLPLKGAFSQFVGGEDIRVSVDDFVVFGGFVQEVERGYVFEDDLTDPTTTLHGTDYNIVLDSRLVYNENWDIKQGGLGKYKNIKPFAEGTSDQEIIRTLVQKYMTAPWLDDFNFQTYVDAIETPAPFGKWTMQAGTQIRQVLTEISRITEGVWTVDPYKFLQYHDRGIVNAPYPITDGDGGIACRGLKIRSRVDVMANDVFVWGTEAYVEASDAEIIYRRETADRDWDVDYWSYRVSRTEEQIATLKAIPYSERSKKQKTRLAALRKRLPIEKRKLAAAQAETEDGSVEVHGRWQHAEFRQDLLKQWAVDRRALAIMNRYSHPVVTGEATVFDPGFQAGQVVEVVSTKHDVSEELVIRSMTLDFAVMKEPVGDEYFAVPRYKLSFGLDPEDPWDIYQYLPFPDVDSNPIGQYNPPQWVFPPPGDGEQGGGTARLFLDSFERTYFSETDFGVATSQRAESRSWVGQGASAADFYVVGAAWLLATLSDNSGLVNAYDPYSGYAVMPVTDLPVYSIEADHTAAAYQGEDISYIPLSENTISLTEPSVLETKELEWKIRFPTTFEGRAPGPVMRHDYSVTGSGRTYLTPGQAATGWYEGVEEAEIHARCDQSWWKLTCVGWGRALFENGEQQELVDLEAGHWYNVVMTFGDVVRCSLFAGEVLLATIIATGAGSPLSVTIGGAMAAETDYSLMALEWEEILIEEELITEFRTIDEYDVDTSATAYGIYELNYDYIPYIYPWALTGDWPDMSYDGYWHNTHGWVRDNSEPTPDVYHDSNPYTYGGEMVLRGSWTTANGWPAFAYSHSLYGVYPDSPLAEGLNPYVVDPTAPWNADGVVRLVFKYDAWDKPASERTNAVEEVSPGNTVLTGIRTYFRRTATEEYPDGRYGEIALILPNPLTETQVADDWGEGPYPNDKPILSIREPGVMTWDTGSDATRYQIFEPDTTAVYVDREWDNDALYVFEAYFIGDTMRARIYEVNEDPPEWMVEHEGMGAYQQEPVLPADVNHLGVRFTVHNYETMRVQGFYFSQSPTPDVDIIPGEADVEPGWNTEVTPVTNGQFVISATPSPGSVNVYNPDGEMLAYGTEWDEVGEDPTTFWVDGAYSYVSVTYFIDTPELGQHAPVARATQREAEENQPRGSQTGMY